MKKNGRILVPLDGSKVAEAILPEVEEQAKAFNANVRIIRSYFGSSENAQAKIAKEADDYVHKMEKALKAKGFKVDSVTTFDADAAQAILEHSKDIDLIMMSTHGQGGIKRFLLGSVAEKVLHHASKPIYLARSVIK